jgi:hypothetical protein
MEIDALGRGLPVMGGEPLTKTVEAAVSTTLVTAIQAANRGELFGQDRELSFGRDDESRRLLIQIKDRKTGEVVQQIPPQQLLKMLHDLRNPEGERANR